MSVLTKEIPPVVDNTAITQADLRALAKATSNPQVLLFMWIVGAAGLALLGLLVLLDPMAVQALPQVDPAEFFVFAALVITAIICRNFFFIFSLNIHLALSMLLCEAGFIIFPPLPAALIGVIPALWFELLITKRGLAYAVRTAGMYAMCGVAARLVYTALGGQAIIGDISLGVVAQVLAAFVVFRTINELILTITQYLQNLQAKELLQKRVIDTSLIYLAMLPAALLLAILKFQVGPVAVLFACACVVMVSIILKRSSTIGMGNVEQLKQMQRLNERLAYQNGRQKRVAIGINQTLDSFLSLVHEYAGISHEQESAVVEITATIEQLSRTATQIASAADNVAGAADKAIYTAEQGQEAVNSTIDAISEVRDKVREIAAKILDLTTKSERIGEIVTTINSIAGQIRLLALNATIEASGAGPFGRRFAVVATEVNELADRSRQAVQQIREIIVEIQQATNSSVRVTEEGLQRMERSVAMASLSEQANREIIDVVQRTAQAAASISLATQQQRSASEQVVTSVHDVAIMIGQNAEKVASVSGTSLELQRIARELQSEEA